MSKLAKIVESLQSQSTLLVLSGNQKRIVQLDSKTGETSNRVHNYTFYTAPKSGIYSLRKLNAFVDAMVPRFDPDKKQHFSFEDHLQSWVLQCGTLSYETQMPCSEAKNEVLNLEEGPYLEFVHVVVYPDHELATSAMLGGHFLERGVIDKHVLVKSFYAKKFGRYLPSKNMLKPRRWR
ncbi:MAG: hypothetical protein ACMXYK_03180 [Candidatus Woesearchaeota archaeon]